MAEGSWVNVPGKGRRWRQPSGELMMTKPGFGQGEFFQTRMGEIGTAGMGAVQGAVDFLNRARIGTGAIKKTQSPKLPAGYSTYGTYNVGGIEYDINSGRPTYMPPGSVYPSTSNAATTASAPADPAERAYVAERARVAQQVAQDPALSQYERNRAAAVAGGDQAKMNAVRDEGMRIWAEKNPELAKKVKPGQSGYDVIKGMMAPSNASSLSDQQVLGVMSFDPNTVLSTTQNIQTQFRPNQQLTDQEILAAMSFDPNVAMRSAQNIASPPMSAVEAQMLKEVGGEMGEYITPMESFVTPAEQRRKSDAFSQLLQGIRQYGGSM